MIVIPFSRSRSMESITRSGTAWCCRKIPLCQSIASTSVVFPWSTWAMIATFRMGGVDIGRGDPLREGALEQLPDRLPAVLLEEAGAGPGEAGAARPRLPRLLHPDPVVLLPGDTAVGALGG